jgi:uncharacterized protein (TIGR02147 family)
MTKSLDLFKYVDYRRYISDWLELARESGQSNLTRLASAIKVHPTFLAHVLKGTKNLSSEQTIELTEALGLTKIEHDYLFGLVNLDKAGSEKLRNYWRQRIKEISQERQKLISRIGKHRELTAEQKATFYSSWLYVAIYVATAIHDGQSLEEIALRFNLSREKSESYLSFLVQTGICEVNNGIYRMGSAVIYLPNESPLVVRHHSNWRIKAMNRMDQREEIELFFTSPMSMSKNDFLKIRNLIAEMIQTSLEICKDSSAEEVVCMNIDFFRAEK